MGNARRAGFLAVAIRVLIAMLIGGGLFWISLKNTLLFHTLAELFAIIVAGSIFALVWNARRILDNGSLLFIGIAFLPIGFIDLIHTLAYKNMNVFYIGTDAPTQLWIGGRAMQSLAFLIAPLLARRRLNAYGILFAWTAAGALLLITIFVWPIFPVCHDGVQLTPFKKIAEYVICAVMGVAAILFWVRRRAYNEKLLRLLIASVVTMIAAELMFTRYAGVFDLSNVIGHFFKIIAFYLMYEAVVATGLLQPYSVLFRNLKRNEEALAVLRDELEARVVERTAQLDRTARDLRVTNRLLQLYAIKYTRKEYLDAAVQIISEVSRCRCVGIRLRDDRGHIPYVAQTGFSEEFLCLERDLSLEHDACVCARIFKGIPDESDKFGLTKDGALYSADFSGFFEAVPDKSRYRGVCARYGYKSVGVAQIRYGDEAIGLIHVADAEKNRIPDGIVALIESIAPLIGEAVHRFDVEAEVRALNVHLERRVEERTLELAQRAVELEAANKELETFSYTVSHDLRAPLRAIDGFTRILQEDHAPKLGDEGLRLLNVIGQNATRMGHLIDDLLDFARLHRQGLSMAQVDMTQLVRETWEELAPLRKDRLFRLELDELPSAHGDRAMLRQVFANLLTNAIKFTGPRTKALVRVAGLHHSGEIVYSVQDNGVGFDMKQADKMFRIFSRLHRPDEFEGTGVGLAIVKHIIERHGGQIGAEAEPEKGARLWFSLPELAKVEYGSAGFSTKAALVKEDA